MVLVEVLANLKCNFLTNNIIDASLSIRILIFTVSVILMGPIASFFDEHVSSKFYSRYYSN